MFFCAGNNIALHPGTSRPPDSKLLEVLHIHHCQMDVAVFVSDTWFAKAKRVTPLVVVPLRLHIRTALFLPS